MSVDRLERARMTDGGLALAAAITTSTCQAAQQAHKLGAIGAVALGRLLTSTALVALMHDKPGAFSVQVLGQGQLGSLFADITDAGSLRGYVRNPALALPLLPGEEPGARRCIGHAVSDGVVSVIRVPADAREAFTQSTAPIVSGEIDEDVASFLETSDQVPTVLAADVMLGAADEVRLAGGLIVQLIPGGDVARLEAIRARLRDGGFASILSQNPDPVALLKAVVAEAEVVGAARPLAWKCRCSHERVIAALRMLEPVQLAEMAQEQDEASVRCDFCGKQYVVTPAQIQQVYAAMVKAEN